MYARSFAFLIAVTFCFATTARSDQATLENGGDSFIAGGSVTNPIDTAGDTFVAARTASAHGASAGDLHVAGLDVSVSADAGEDLYAVGASVVVRGVVAQDLTAAGFSVRTESTSRTLGNARLFGNSVTVEGAVSGALTVSGADVILNAPIAGDVRIAAGTISFGPEATIGGALVYSSGREISVPERVLPAARVTFERIEWTGMREAFDELRAEMPVLPTFMSWFFWFVISLLFFVALGAVILAFMPSRLEAMRRTVVGGPGRAILMGAIGLSILFGIVPIAALTIIGLPVVPIALLAIVVAWILGYALGVYSVAMHIWTGLGGDAEVGNLGRLLVFAAAFTFVAMLNFIPFVGWVANYTLVLLGIGGMTHVVFVSLVGNRGTASDTDMKPIED